MASQPVKKVLSLVRGAKKLSPGKWQALCPAHGDHNPSLSVSQGADGRALLHCHAGCETREILAKLGLEARELFVRRSVRSRSDTEANNLQGQLTVEKLAAHFKLTSLRLRVNGIEDSEEGVVIPYFDLDGTLLSKSRLRRALHGSGRFKWRGSGPIYPYGLNYVPVWRERFNFLILAEGESDVWAAWQRGVPALGIPGTAQVRCLRLAFVSAFTKLYLLREPDSGGDVFAGMIPVQLAKIGWTGALFEMRFDGIKDLADLHRLEPDRFDILLKSALNDARRLAIPEAASSGFDVLRPRRLRGFALKRQPSS